MHYLTIGFLAFFSAGTPNITMSLSRSPSPVPGGGWSSPGLNINGSGRSTPVTGYSTSNGNPTGMWESARQKNMGAVPSFSTQNQGFFTRHMRRISSSLPRFNSNTHYAEKEKLGRGRLVAPATSANIPLLGRLRGLVARMGRKMKLRLLLISLILFCVLVFYTTRMSPLWLRLILPLFPSLLFPFCEV